MPTNDERREVARRLRSLDIPARVKMAEHPEKTAAWYELICSAVGGKKDPWFGIKALADRLADLIEPTVGVVSAVEFDETYHTGFEYVLSCGHEFEWAWSKQPAYCPVCGARIRGEGE